MTTKPLSPQVPKYTAVNELLGPHPAPPNVFGSYLAAADAPSNDNVPHRTLTEQQAHRPMAIATIRKYLTTHHASPATIARIEQLRERVKRAGGDPDLDMLRRFPKSPTTQRGNLGEIVLAEYIVAASKTTLPIYRLRYNPNIDQSMKGDDVLAFDLDAEPVRIVVGESKFRGTSAPEAVREITANLLKSHSVNLPISLPFIANRLFDEGKDQLAQKVLDCSIRFAEDRLRIDYVGLLFSDTKAARHVNEYATSTMRRLVLLSWATPSPEAFVDECYAGLE